MPKTRIPQPKIRRRKHRHCVSYQVDCGLHDGKRQRKSFQSVEDAQEYAASIRAKIRHEGAAAFNLSDSVRVDAVRAFSVLNPFEARLVDAAEYYKNHFLSYKNAPVIKNIVEEFVQSAVRNNRRKMTTIELRNRLKVFSLKFGEFRPCEISSQDIETWIHENKDWSTRTKINYLTKISQLMNFAIKRNWADKNLVDSIDKPSVEETEAEIFTIEESSMLLKSSIEFNVLAHIALGLFAGLRSAEISRLRWEYVIMEKDCIKIPASVAKKRSQRTIMIEPVLKAWLELIKKENGPVIVARNFRKRLDKLKEKIGPQRWKVNGLRHSFGSYHLAKFGNEIRTAKEMGHRDANVIHNHYKALVLPDDAEAYWNLTPEKVLKKTKTTLETSCPRSEIPSGEIHSWSLREEAEGNRIESKSQQP